MSKTRRKKRYTAAQKRAYYSGQGYRAAYEGKKIPFKGKQNKKSFRQGFASARVIVVRYPKLEK